MLCWPSFYWMGTATSRIDPSLHRFRDSVYFCLIIQPISAPAVKATRKCVATVTTRWCCMRSVAFAQELLGSIVPFFAAPHHSGSFLYCVGNHTGYARCLPI
jgi:hypothetical protein